MNGWMDGWMDGWMHGCVDAILTLLELMLVLQCERIWLVDSNSLLA